MAELTLNSTLLFRTDSNNNWSTSNPILKAGEPGWDSINKRLKIGDGTTLWNNLSFAFPDPLIYTDTSIGRNSASSPSLSSFSIYVQSGEPIGYQFTGNSFSISTNQVSVNLGTENSPWQIIYFGKSSNNLSDNLNGAHRYSLGDSIDGNILNMFFGNSLTKAPLLSVNTNDGILIGSGIYGSDTWSTIIGIPTISLGGYVHLQWKSNLTTESSLVPYYDSLVNGPSNISLGTVASPFNTITLSTSHPTLSTSSTVDSVTTKIGTFNNSSILNVSILQTTNYYHDYENAQQNSTLSIIKQQYSSLQGEGFSLNIGDSNYRTASLSASKIYLYSAEGMDIYDQTTNNITALTNNSTVLSSTYNYDRWGTPTSVTTKIISQNMNSGSGDYYLEFGDSSSLHVLNLVSHTTQGEISIKSPRVNISLTPGTSSSSRQQFVISGRYTTGAIDSLIINMYNSYMYPNKGNGQAGFDLGRSTSTRYRFRTLYCTSVDQTSDSSMKYNIQYLDGSELFTSPLKTKISTSNRATTSNLSNNTLSLNTIDTEKVTTDDVISFVKSLKPATFLYSNYENTEEDIKPESVQIGLIADDIKDNKLFQYVGTCIKEQVDGEETGTELLSLKILPLTVVALTACKDLLTRIEELEETIDNLSNK